MCTGGAIMKQLVAVIKAARLFSPHQIQFRCCFSPIRARRLTKLAELTQLIAELPMYLASE